MSRHELEAESKDLHEEAMKQVEQICRETPPEELARRRTAALRKVQGWMSDSNPPKPKILL